MLKRLLLFLLAFAFLPFTASASVLGTQQGGTAIATTSAKAIFWVDGTRTDTYVKDGSILAPFTTVSGMLANLPTRSGYSFNLAPGTYVDGAPDTFPSVPFYISGNEATLVEPSGVTFPKSFDIYDLTIVGNVRESDTSLSAIHQFNNGVISGNLQVDGLTLLSGMVVTGGNYFLISTSSLANNSATLFQNPIWSNGVDNLNDVQISTTTTQALVSATTTSFTSTGQYGNLNILGATMINPGGPGINAPNGATSTINNYTALTVQVNSTHALMIGNANTAACDYQFNNLLTGVHITPEASSTTAIIPCYDWNLIVEGGATSTSLGITGLANPAGKFLAIDPSGNVIATTSPVGGSASSTLLGDSNTFSGTDVFSKALSLTSTTGTTSISTGQGFTIGSNQFVLQQSSGRAGIGTNAPTALLDILGDYPSFKVRNYDAAQFSGAGFYLTNTAMTGLQAGYTFYGGINDAADTQGYFAIDQTNTSGAGTGHLLLITGTTSFESYLPILVNGNKNQLSEDASGGNLDYQQVSGGNGQQTLFNMFANTTNPQEATLALIRATSTSYANAEFSEFTDENYGATGVLNGGVDHAASFNINKKGTGTFRPLLIRFWNQDLGTVASTSFTALSIVPNTNNTGTVPISANIGIATSSPYGLLSLQLNSGATTSLAFVIASSTPSATTTLFSINNAGLITTLMANNSIVTTNGSGQLVASSTIGWNLLKGPASSIFAFDGSGNPIATSSIGVNYLSGILPVANGGTGQSSFGQGWLNSDGTTISASTSPTVRSLYATTTIGVATSSFAGGINVTATADQANIPAITCGISTGNNNCIGISGGRAMMNYNGAATLEGGASHGVQLWINDVNGKSFSGTQAVTVMGTSGASGFDSVGIATTTPWGFLSLQPGALGSTTPQFISWVSGSSTPSFMIASANNNGYVGVGTSTPQTSLVITKGASATTTVSVGELGLSSSKACVNIQTSAGTAGYFYLNAAGTVVSGLGPCT